MGTMSQHKTLSLPSEEKKKWKIECLIFRIYCGVFHHQNIPRKTNWKKKLFNARISITLRVRYTLSEYFSTDSWAKHLSTRWRWKEMEEKKSDFNSQPKAEQLKWHDCGFCFWFLTQWSENVRVNWGGSERLNGLNIIYNQIPSLKQQNDHTHIKWIFKLKTSSTSLNCLYDFISAKVRYSQSK